MQQRDVARGCVDQIFSTAATLACLIGFFTFAWFAVALLLLAMYPQDEWSGRRRAAVGATAVITAGSAVICFLGAVRVFPVRRRGKKS